MKKRLIFVMVTIIALCAMIVGYVSMLWLPYWVITGRALHLDLFKFIDKFDDYFIQD